MLSYLGDLESIWGPMRLFQFITFRGMMAAATAFAIGFLAGPWFFARLRALKLGQPLRTVLEVGKLSELHESKEGTPTMGGLLIFVSLAGSMVLWVKPNVYTVVALVVYTGLTMLGFADDYLKIRHQNSGGVKSRVKLLCQGIITVIAMVLLLCNDSSHSLMRELWVPFFKEPVFDQMYLWFMFLFLFLVLGGSSNAINLTDGVDGLAIGCTVTVAMVFAVMSYCSGHAIIADYLNVRHILGTGELAVVCGAMVGAGLAFLWYNAHPAEVFMGDTGSLALGGLVGIIAFMVHQAFTLIIVGGIFVMEAGSVILQVGSYKLRGGKRIFLMAPIHHHFEIKGWKETKVVIRFWILSLIFAIAGLATLKLR